MSAISWEESTWSLDALEEALVTLARAAGHEPRRVATSGTPRGDAGGDARARDRWIEAIAHAAGLEAEPVECTYGELASVLGSLGPALVRVPTARGPRYLAVLSSRRGHLLVIAPSLARRRVACAELFHLLTASMAEGPSGRVEAWLAVARIGVRKASKARAELLKHFLDEQRVGEMWLLRADPGSSFTRELRRQGVLPRATWFALASLAQVAVSVLGWALIGRSSLSGVLDRGWLLMWVLVTLTAVPLQLASVRLGGRLGMDIASALKQRMLAGALRLDPDSIRTEGSGRLLAMVSESTAIETAGLGGAFSAAVALVQLASAAIVLALGAGGALHLGLLFSWCGVLGVLVVRSHRRRTAWTSERLALTNGFVENVVGNRTRIAQQAPAQWHRLEDDMVSRYLASSRAMDSVSAHLAALPSRGWLLLGLLGLVPAILAHSDTTHIAISIGGILQAQTAFAALTTSAVALLGAHVAWRSVGRLFHAAAAVPAAGLPDVALEGTARRASLDAKRPVVVLDARGVSFRYRASGEPVLRDCALTVRDGDRVLVEGRSGGGKSTLAALLVGQRTPETGHILLRGLDSTTLGARGWRQRVASAPQFHDNHVLSATLGFNLLMGRSWPPSDGDRREAEAVCRDLGLGSLLDRMPSGLDQVVGETGWQLSHGERSRIFLARALLQRADLVVLDETFGALDPLTLKTCVDTAIARAPALVVIAHP